MSGDHNINQDKRLEKAAEHLGSGALKMIKAILMKHDAAIIEASQEAIEAAVLAEREEVALEFEKRHESVRHLNNYWLHAAKYVRARGSA
jgi:hypothetical protein